jgi:hypothetical protein
LEKAEKELTNLLADKISLLLVDNCKIIILSEDEGKINVFLFSFIHTSNRIKIK